MEVLKIKRSYILMAVLIVSALSFSAFGVFTPVFQPVVSGEANHPDILGIIYDGGTDFTGQGSNLGNGMWSEYVSADNSIIAYRIDDDFDQIWGADADVAAKAKYAGLNQSFGWDGGALTGADANYIELLTDADIYGPSVAITAGSNFLWGINPSGSQGPYLWWSNPAFNPDQRDHMVTYSITGLNTNNVVYLLFFEDLPPTGRPLSADWDYNDFVVEVSQVPEPTSIAILGFGVLASLLHRRGSLKK